MTVALSVVAVVADALPLIPLIEKKILLLHASFSLAVLVNGAGNTTLADPLLASPLASVVQLEPPFCVRAKSTLGQLIGG
ncbi:hypothetical protein ACK4AA_21680 [Aeromonas veronii]|uniref:hypothetical protein n=1 Tax=Aeromonas veronii TaxID=654 RepID=UPI000B23582F|nr:hypothetical protein [Aeromonas veronii]